MKDIFYYLAWEWVNISLEYTAVAWVRLPRLFWAVAGVNLVTHPVFMFLLEWYDYSFTFILVCEAIIPFVECLILMIAYGRARWRMLLGIAVLMNAVSFGVGLLIAQ